MTSMCACRLLARIGFHYALSPIPLPAMDFSEDEDFFARAAEEQEEFLPFEGYDCHLPHEELPPEIVEIIPDAEEMEVGTGDNESSQPRDETVDRVEELSASPSRTSDTASSATSPARPLPTLESRGRKRLREKTKPTGPWLENGAPDPVKLASYQPPAIPGLDSLEAARNDWWDAKPEREKKRYFWNYVKRNNLYNTYYKSVSRQRQRSLPESWLSLEPMHLKEFVDWVLKLPAVVLAACVRVWLRRLAGLESSGMDQQLGGRVVDPGKQLLMTWQGHWGVVKRADAPRATCVLSATEALKKDRYVQSLWAKAQTNLGDLKEQLNAEDVGASLELCARTFEQGSIRIHLHACYVSHTARMRKMELSALKVFGSSPHLSTDQTARQHRRRAAQHSAMYYVLAPKIGSLCTSTTMRPHHEFEVNAEWIWSMVASHKIELSAARRELVASGKNLSRHLQNMDVLMKERANEANEDLIAQRNQGIAATRKPFRKIPAVTAWIEELSAPLDRRKFLVLDGPTRMGKTAFAFSLVEAGAALEVNCAGVEDPPLRAFSRSKHRLILFDEASTHMVLKNKRLFQAPNTPVIVGSSPTNALAYSVYLGDTLLVVCSNDWEQELATLPAGQRDWLVGNMVFVSVKEKLYT